MTSINSFEGFNSQLREFIRVSQESLPQICSALEERQPTPNPSREGNSTDTDERLLPYREDARVVRLVDAEFNQMALALFALQFAHVEPYRRLCEARGITPDKITRWSEIPPVPAAAFKEFDLSSIPVAERTTVFHSSGTTAQRPSRHFHNAESLSIYETSLLPWFKAHLLADTEACRLLILTPSPALAPHSSLVRMFDAVRRDLDSGDSIFSGTIDAPGAWRLDTDAALDALRKSMEMEQPVVLLGTAFSFVHLLDDLSARALRFDLPAGSRVMETGGYKGRSRSLPGTELHALITRCLGIPRSHIVCEYGMSELSSQAYDWRVGNAEKETWNEARAFRFPPWARARVVSPETGGEVAEGDTGLIQICDLANVRSVMVVQTKDLATRRCDGFELLGRAALAEARGCSLLST